MRARVDSVDLLRGVIMVIMMLDHTRDFVHFQAALFDPTNVSQTYPLLFFTRWITHFCAPVFVFLAGTGAYFQELRGKPKSELSRFLITRGIWLIVLEFTVLRVIIFFNFDYPVFMGFLQVIWVIGWGMIVLAGVIHLPLRVIVALSVAMIFLHNALDGIHVTSWNGPGTPVPGFGASLWKVLHEPGLIFPFGYPGPAMLALYPLIPWIGVMAAGYAFGSLYRLDEAKRRRFLVRFGAAITLGFIVLRAINIYGDPAPWSVQSSTVKSALSFLALSKYPPSLLYLMMTLGPAMLFLAWFEGHERGKLASIFIVYGRVPLFFYLLQWITTHTLALVAGRIAGKPTDYLFTNIGFSPPPAPDSGFGLAMVYALWILGVVLLYPLCRWYAAVKARRRDWWLSYL
ncbi:MAG: heparan-alpha-glucosaminide N-acetyltransferase domain-containing protein [Gemmatimonadota bacterium]|nr:heparan-alpha-glucosaminide N-acetyltransferase domain-containing protein [Gemmatimonadota bacterium]